MHLALKTKMLNQTINPSYTEAVQQEQFNKVLTMRLEESLKLFTK